MKIQNKLDLILKENNACYLSDWIHFQGVYQWIISADISNSYLVCRANSNGNLNYGSDTAQNTYDVVPTVFLKPTIVSINGNGSKDTPYELSVK